jgi:hypothetical protein
MNFERILKVAQEGNADQAYAWLDEYRNSDSSFDDTMAGYELELLMIAYEESIVDDAEFCSEIVKILNQYFPNL